MGEAKEAQAELPVVPAGMIVCGNCESEWVLDEVLKRRATRIKRVWDIGILCLNCATWTHSFFTSDALEVRRKSMMDYLKVYEKYRDGMHHLPAQQRIAQADQAFRNYKRLQRVFGGEFQAFQRRMKRLGSSRKIGQGEILYDPYTG